MDRPPEFNAAFKKWFGRSAVVDENGDPLVVWHASTEKFRRFDTSKEGAHFGTHEQAENVNKVGLRNPMPFFLSIVNPLRLPDIGVWRDFNNLHASLARYDAITMAEADAIWSEWQRSDAAGWAAIKKTLLNRGYDGIVYENEQEGAGDSWIAFYPSQIKSVDNDGTWDADDPDIRSNPEGVGFSWDSKEGRRTILREVQTQNGQRLEVATEGHPFSSLFKPEEIDREIYRDTKNLEFHARQAQAVAERGRQDEQKRKAYEDVDGFDSGMKPVQRAKVLAALNHLLRLNGVEDSRKNHIRRLVRDGWRVSASKGGRILAKPDGVFLKESDLTKTALDYAEYLLVSGNPPCASELLAGARRARSAGDLKAARLLEEAARRAR